MILIGAPGSGKTEVLDALCTQLEIDGVPFGAIESEHLSRGWPWLVPAQWLPQLAAIVALQRDAGRDTFLVVATTENEQELTAVIDAVGADHVTVVCLTAPGDVVAKRVVEREPDRWPGKTDLIEHARRLAAEIPAISGIDVLISTLGRDPDDVASQIKEQLLERGIAGPG
jgi:adenylate kinase family enzyme